jgi:hypothetical protein
MLVCSQLATRQVLRGSQQQQVSQFAVECVRYQIWICSCYPVQNSAKLIFRPVVVFIDRSIQQTKYTLRRLTIAANTEASNVWKPRIRDQERASAIV